MTHVVRTGAVLTLWASYAITLWGSGGGDAFSSHSVEAANQLPVRHLPLL
jgi:hypothetical protein